MDIAARIVEKLLPVFLLIFLGWILKKKAFFAEETIEDLKRMIVSISLPAILFSAFLALDLQASYVLVFVVIFAVCVLLYLAGKLLAKATVPENKYLPFLMTGFEFGMLGTVFFGAVFGLENIGYIGIIALGHELFIWFVYVTLLKNRTGKKADFQGILRSLSRSPVIIAVCAGLLLNGLGAGNFMASFPPAAAFLKTLDYLAKLTVPLILLIIGWNLQLNRRMIRDSLMPVLLRLTLVIVSAVIIDFFIFRRALHLDPLFSAALYIFFLLPPPYILPLYLPREEPKEIASTNNFLVLYTLVCIAAFSIFTVFYLLRYR